MSAAEAILTPQRLQRLSTTYSVTLSPAQQEQLELFLSLLLKWRRRINLISEPDLDRLLDLHAFESLWLARTLLPRQGQMADIGSGAGFPAIPAKIHTSRLALVCIEPQHKKATFLGEVTRQLGFADTSLFDRRWQEFNDWDSVDFVTLRAIHPSPPLLQRLARQRLPLFHLHSSEKEVESHLYQPLKRVQVPGSRRRFASFLGPT